MLQGSELREARGWVCTVDSFFSLQRPENVEENESGGKTLVRRFGDIVGDLDFW